MKMKLFALLAALAILLGCLAGCQADPNPTDTGTTNPPTTTEGKIDPVDYAGTVQLDMDSNTLKQEVTVKAFIDGDTTHFYVPSSVVDTGLLKARYLAVNTPESTGKIEEWGKKAARFTREKLENADSILIESDNNSWNLDSTGGRHLVWVWYRPKGADSYRNLNIELLQNGLSIASNSADNQYGEICMQAIAQAKREKLHMHSKEKDPDFYYGEAIPVTLKGLRSNIALYEGLKVTFEGVVTRKSGQTVYAEDYDAETDMYYGMTVYYGYNLGGTGVEILEPGNRVSFIGTVQYYELGQSWQISDIKYVETRPNDPNNIQLISGGHKPAHRPTTTELLFDSKLDVEVMSALDSEETTVKSFDYAQLALGSSVFMENLYVDRISTTTNEDSESKGAMTFTCRVGNDTISVRTTVLRDKDGNLITQDAYAGKTINVYGVLDYFSGTYQIKVFSTEDIQIVD